MTPQHLPRRVLLLGGPSGSAKSVAAERIGRRQGVSWMQVDDLRLALQYGGSSPPCAEDPLGFFERTPNV